MSRTCTDCIRECPPGVSFCGRKDEGGNLIGRHTYSAVRIDRLFEKPIIHWGPDIRLLSLGSWGCNFRCPGCQNAALSWSRDGAGLGAIKLDPAAAVRMALENSCRGLGFTFNEPAVWLDPLAETAAEAHRKGLLAVLVTNSTLTESAARRIAPLIDAVAADLKSMDDGFYRSYCGADGIPNVAAKVRACISLFRRAGCHVEVRTNIIPGGNDNLEDLIRIAGWILDNLGPETPWHVTRFFPTHELRATAPTPTRTLLNAQRLGLRAGLHRVHAHYARGCDCAPASALLDPGTDGKAPYSLDCCR